MKTFDDCFTALMGSEGGYSNNPADPGGETMWGITKRVALRHGYTGAMKDLPQSTAKQIARAEYWNPLSLDQIDINLAFQVFDGSYNSGQTQSALWLQRAAGVKDDGVIGPMTIAAVNALPSLKLCLRYNAQRLQFLASLNSWPTFGKGWARRIATNLSHAGE